jgi:hypothetical protein
MNKVQKLSSPDCNTPSSEPFTLRKGTNRNINKMLRKISEPKTDEIITYIIQKMTK